MTLVEIGIREVLVVGEELILIVPKADHVVAAPVLVEELPCALFVEFLQRGFSGNLRSPCISADLIEEILCTALS